LGVKPNKMVKVNKMEVREVAEMVVVKEDKEMETLRTAAEEMVVEEEVTKTPKTQDRTKDKTVATIDKTGVKTLPMK